MGFWDAITHPVDTLKSIGSGIVGATGSGAAMQPGSVGGPAADPSQLKQDPTTGLWFDPTTGTTYTDNSGMTPVKNPNVAQQVASNFATQQGFLDRLRVSQGQQEGLAGDLSRTIHDVNAPSVAQQQLNQGLGQIQRQQLSQAASVGGQGGVLARLIAANNSAAAGGAENQAAALARAQEVAQAQNSLAGVLQSLSGTNAAGANAFGNLASGGAATQQAEQLAQANQSQKNRQDFFTNLMKVVGLGGSIGAGGPGGGGGGGSAGGGTTQGLGGLTAAV